ncbi:3',5'-cyclic AMP phosphodiesterase CpdA [Amycolatopsis marina]|uniref:3',5'-cyclic AMP phosphodiesterase CpdA n=1 Tax=Amycolatopsis marina TaxID=490629 RepID=A0A1I0VYZ5_9PSEU|nr:calcineurin-like phosphoesterase family protein [Amycolatopsis marina]SFA81408.1 3',5'-cyclic AMP phosphodiesterase CpdA [Amycolatopsis marina]
MNPNHHPPTLRPARIIAGTVALATVGALLTPAASAAPGGTPVDADWETSAYRGSVDIVKGTDENPDLLDGTVFNDKNRNSKQDTNEPGITGVTVSNGRDVVTTDEKGRYQLPAFENMTVFVTQPRGYQVPVDQDNVAQFYYHHLPQGSPELKFRGIAPTGALPDAVNFPLAQSKLTQSPEQHCLIGGDVQTYDQRQVEYARAGAFADLANRDDYMGCGALFIGDVVGDDLDLYEQTRELAGMLNGPARFLPGNHDLDFDAPNSEHAFDSFRAQFGPEYYSYDAGKAHVVALSNVEYPLSRNGYNGALDERQLEWLRQDIAAVPEGKLIVLAGHIPLLDFADQGSTTHQIDQVKEIYQILEGREAITLGGHTHSIENMRAGDSLKGWQDVFGVNGLPFTHITAGAISGDWYSGRMLEQGYPTAIQRDGGVPGVLTLDIRNTEVTERFTVRGKDNSEQLALGLNSPRYRDWYADNVGNKGSAPEFGDPLTVTKGELSGTWLTTNFWMGSTGAEVKVAIDGAAAGTAERTQQMNGEAPHVGAEWSDPVAVQEQLVHGGSLADRSMHLWRLRLPSDLAVGEHTAEVTATDVHGREFTESLTFEVTE